MALVETAEGGLQPDVLAGTVSRKRRRARRWTFLGVLPFFAFITLFLLIPTGKIVLDTFETATGGFTLSNVDAIFHAPYPSAFEFSIELSALSALWGGILGFLVANAVLHHGIPRWVRPAYLSFSGMAANFAGVPLAFAFTATLGSLGVVTVLLKHLGINIYPTFSLQGLLGASLVYLFFQFPLMILLMVPVIEGLRKEWREAASNLGAGSFGFWRHIGLPVITPSLLGLMVLLFGNAFSAYATAYALGISNLPTIQIGQFVNGNNGYDPQDAYALAFGMIVVIVITIIIYSLLQRRTSRWLK
ncbi:MAG: ABC transporter permease subunit [Acidimicrobiales bacterium]|jgi:putative spermidine/putrescine transport system permease protein